MKIMIKTLCLVSVLAISAGAQTCEWIKTAGYPKAPTPGVMSLIQGKGIGSDAAGNVYVAGQFHDTTTFDTEAVAAHSADDLFIAKYNSAGAIQWVKTASGPNGGTMLNIAVDAAGNSYTFGLFNDTTVINGQTVISDKKKSIYGNSYDMFVLAMDAAGTTRWLQTSTGFAATTYGKIRINNAGTVILMTTLNGATDFCGGSFTDRGILLGKINTADGTFDWSTVTSAGVWAPPVVDMAVDNAGNIAVTGPSGYSALTFGTTTVPASNFYTAFFNNAGAFQWVQTVSGLSFLDNVFAVALDAAGDVYIGGSATAAAVFGTETMANSGGFLAKYNSTGTIQWLKEITGTGVTNITALAGGWGNVYAAGTFQIKMFFDTGDSLTTTAAQKSSYIASFSSDGVPTAIAGAQSSQEVTTNAISIDNTGNLYATGIFRIRVQWGDVSENASTLTGQGALVEMFAAKFSGTVGIADHAVMTPAMLPQFAADGYYDLSGRRINGIPAQPGMYVTFPQGAAEKVMVVE